MKKKYINLENDINPKAQRIEISYDEFIKYFKEIVNDIKDEKYKTIILDSYDSIKEEN